MSEARSEARVRNESSFKVVKVASLESNNYNNPGMSNEKWLFMKDETRAIMCIITKS